MNRENRTIKSVSVLIYCNRTKQREKETEDRKLEGGQTLEITETVQIS